MPSGARQANVNKSVQWSKTRALTYTHAVSATVPKTWVEFAHEVATVWRGMPQDAAYQQYRNCTITPLEDQAGWTIVYNSTTFTARLGTQGSAQHNIPAQFMPAGIQYAIARLCYAVADLVIAQTTDAAEAAQALQNDVSSMLSVLSSPPPVNTRRQATADMLTILQAGQWTAVRISVQGSEVDCSKADDTTCRLRLDFGRFADAYAPICALIYLFYVFILASTLPSKEEWDIAQQRLDAKCAPLQSPHPISGASGSYAYGSDGYNPGAYSPYGSYNPGYPLTYASYPGSSGYHGYYPGSYTHYMGYIPGNTDSPAYAYSYYAPGSTPGATDPAGNTSRLSSETVDMYIQHVKMLMPRLHDIFSRLKQASATDTKPWFMQNPQRYENAYAEIYNYVKHADTSKWFDTSMWTVDGAETDRCTPGTIPETDSAFMQKLIRPLFVPYDDWKPGRRAQPLRDRMNATQQGLWRQIQGRAGTRSQVGGTPVVARIDILSELGFTTSMKCPSADAYNLTKVLTVSLCDCKAQPKGGYLNDDARRDPLKHFFPDPNPNPLGGGDRPNLITRMYEPYRMFHEYCRIFVEAAMMMLTHMPPDWGVRVYVDDSVSEGELPQALNIMAATTQGKSRLQVVHVRAPMLLRKDSKGLHELYLPTMFRTLAFWDPRLTHAVTTDADNYPSPCFLQHIQYWADHMKDSFIGVRLADNAAYVKPPTEAGHTYTRRTYWGERKCIPQVIAWCFGCKKQAGQVLHPAVLVNMMEYLRRAHAADRALGDNNPIPPGEWDTYNMVQTLAKSPFDYTCDEQAPANVLVPLIHLNNVGMFTIPTFFNWCTINMTTPEPTYIDNFYTVGMHAAVFQHAAPFVKDAFRVLQVKQPAHEAPGTVTGGTGDAAAPAWNVAAAAKRHADLPAVDFDITDLQHHRWSLAALRASRENYTLLARHDNQLHVHVVLYMAMWEIMAEGKAVYNQLFPNAPAQPADPYDTMSLHVLPYWAWYTGGDYLLLTWADTCEQVADIVTKLKAHVLHTPPSTPTARR